MQEVQADEVEAGHVLDDSRTVNGSVGVEDRQVDPVEAGVIAAAPDHVRDVEHAAVLQQRAPVPHAGPIALICGGGLLACASLGLWDPLVVLFAGGLILGLGGLDNDRAGLLASKAGVWLGEISYSIYMVCAPVLLLGVNVAARLTGAEDKKLHILVWLAVLAAIPVVAALTYHLVERPARKALRGLAARNGSARPEVAAQANSPERVLQPSETIV